MISNWMTLVTWVVIIISISGVKTEFFSPSYQPVEETGSLSGDVLNWAEMIQNYISQV